MPLTSPTTFQFHLIVYYNFTRTLSPPPLSLSLSHSASDGVASTEQAASIERKNIRLLPICSG
jgi:hypothetical protein